MPLEQDFKSPIVFLTRAGTLDDPYVEKIETNKKIDQNGIIQLEEIPAENTNLYIVKNQSGEIVDTIPFIVRQGNIIFTQIKEDLIELQPNQYRVDYINGLLYFNPKYHAGTTINMIQYVGRGAYFIPTSRIYTGTNTVSEYLETMQSVVDEANRVIESAAEYVLPTNRGQIFDDSNLSNFAAASNLKQWNYWIVTDDITLTIDTENYSVINYDNTIITTGTIEVSKNSWLIYISNNQFQILSTTVSITKADLGLDKVDNTSDMEKPVSIPQQQALDAKFDKAGGIITGDLTVEGKFIAKEQVILNTTEVTISDNIITINKDQTGIPPSSLKSGIEVERGDFTNYQFVFDESDDLFKIGKIGDLQPVATREISPVPNQIFYWDNENNRIINDKTLSELGILEDKDSIIKTSHIQNGAITTEKLSSSIVTSHNNFAAHIDDSSNPHNVTAAQVGAVPNWGGTFTGSVNINSNLYAYKYFQKPFGYPITNLGNPTVTEMALFEEEFNNKLAFYDISKIKFFTSDDGINWTEFIGFSDTEKRKLVGGDDLSSIYIPNGKNFRIQIENSGKYVYLNALYAYISTNSHRTAVKIRKRNYDTQVWEQHTDSDTTVSICPGHLYLPFDKITFDDNNHYDVIQIDFYPVWNTEGSYSSSNINIYKLQIWGGYPAGKRRIYTIDENQNVDFPAQIKENGVRVYSPNNKPTPSDIGALPTSWKPDWSDIQNKPTLDNYDGWNFAINGTLYDKISSGGNLDFIAGNNVTITRSAANKLTIAATQRAVHDTPVNGATFAAISSNWAYNNVKTPVPSNAKFTDTNYYVTGGFCNGSDLILNRAGLGDITIDMSSLMDNTDTYPTDINFNTSNGMLSVNLNNGSMLSVDLDGRYLTSYTDTYPTDINFNTSNGILSVNLNNESMLSVDLDGRYAIGTESTEANSNTIVKRTADGSIKSNGLEIDGWTIEKDENNSLIFSF